MSVTSETAIEKQIKSMIWMRQQSDTDILRAEKHILETYRDGAVLSDEEFFNYNQIIHSLKDSGYLRCGISSEFQVTYKTTEAGKDYLARLGQRLGE